MSYFLKRVSVTLMLTLLAAAAQADTPEQMLAAYSALIAIDVPLVFIMMLLATLLVAGIAPLCLLLWRQHR